MGLGSHLLAQLRFTYVWPITGDRRRQWGPTGQPHYRVMRPHPFADWRDPCVSPVPISRIPVASHCHVGRPRQYLLLPTV
jgi:hypothetical protein